VRTGAVAVSSKSLSWKVYLIVALDAHEDTRRQQPPLPVSPLSWPSYRLRLKPLLSSEWIERGVGEAWKAKPNVAGGMEVDTDAESDCAVVLRVGRLG
jgi:hypothetical protein